MNEEVLAAFIFNRTNLSYKEAEDLAEEILRDHVVLCADY